MYQVPEEIQSRSGVDTDADRVRGIIIASSFSEVANKPANLRKIGAVASIIGVGQLIFEGATIENVDWENEINWKQYGGGSVEICDQTDVEQAEPTENTKATSALRAWQGYVYWCKNTLFPELNTSDKTIVGSVNETYELAKNGSAVGGYANNLYFDETASDVVGYETLSYTPAALEATEVWTVNDSEGVKIFQNYLYPSAVSVSLIPAGQWSFQFWGNVSSGAGVTKLGATYFKRSALGVETDLLTIWSSEIDNTTPDWIKFSLTFPNFTVEPTDRMGCRVIGQTTHNSDITITYVVGDGYGAWLNNPNRVRHTQLRDFNGDSTVQHIDNSTVKATPIDADKVALWDSVAGKMVTATISSIKMYVKLGLTASEVGVTASAGYPATDQQSYNTNNAARVVKLETNETPASIADTDNVRFKSVTGYYVRTLLAIKNYVKLGLKASEVLNDSLNVLGITLKDVLDKATLAIDGVTMQDGDLFPIAREVEAPAGVFTSVNMYHPWDRIKSELVDKHVYQYNVSTWEEIQAVVSDPLCRESIVFNIMQPVYAGTLQTYAKNIYFRGAKIIMQSDTNLWISGYAAGTYNIYLDCLLETGSLGMPAYITLGDTQVVSTINLKVKQIQGLSTNIIATIELIEIGASNTTTITYNELVNVQLINTSITAIQEDTFYALQTEVTRVRITTGGISLNNAFVGTLRPGWGLDNITTMWISGGGTNMEVRPQLQITGGTYDYIAAAGPLRSNALTHVFNNYITAPLFYDATGSSNKFTWITDNYTTSNNTIVLSMTDSANAVIDVIIKTKRTI